MLYKLVLNFDSVDEILWCDHSHESYYWPFAKYPHSPSSVLPIQCWQTLGQRAGERRKKEIKSSSLPNTCDY